jgi:drug/metabolite transporter (DMT)-like permease
VRIDDGHLGRAGPHWRRRRYRLALAAFGAFATTDAIVKLASDALPVQQVAFYMTLASLLPILAVIGREGGFARFWPSVPGLVLLRSAFAVGSTLFAFHAFARLPLADVYAIIFTVPLWVTILSVPVLGETVGWRRATAVLVGFVGVLIMVRPGEASLEAGHLMAAACALCASCAFLTTKRIGGRARGGTQLLAASLAMLMVTAPSVVAGPAAFDPGLFLLIGTAGVLMGLAQFAIWQALKLSAASLVVPFQYSQLLWALFYGAVLFETWPEPATLAGAVVVIGSGLYIMQRERRLGRGGVGG